MSWRRWLWHGGQYSNQILHFVWRSLDHAERGIRQIRAFLFGAPLCPRCEGTGLAPNSGMRVQPNGWHLCEWCHGSTWEPQSHG